MSRLYRPSLPLDLALCGLMAVLTACAVEAEPAPELVSAPSEGVEEVPDRFVEFALAPGPSEEQAGPMTAQDQGVGEGKAGANKEDVAASSGLLKLIASRGESLDGVFGSSALNSEVGDAGGGSIGSGGLGSRGVGIGGGGAATGLGTLGTKGYGSSSGVGYASARRAPLQESQLPPAQPRFTDYGVNGFVRTAEDALSTFAIDVDTASYSMTRRQLTDGYLPAAASVRVEEFVNSFDYEYRQPAPGSPFAVDFEASPSPWNPRSHIVRVGVQGRELTQAQRKPVHLTFLVDTSGSMQSADKLGLVRKTLTMLTNELRDGDTVAIATYAGNTSVVLRPTAIGQRGTILRALDGLSAGGSTAMGAGIDLAYGLADESFVSGAVNRVIVCSDGDANVGQTSHDALSATIKGYAAKGITLTTVGFGTGNYNDTMMERLANDGDGNYAYIDSEREARRVFVDKLESTMEVIAKDVKIQVEWDPTQVVSYRLIGYENRDIADKDFRDDKVDAGEIGAGHQVTAVYEVMLAEGGSGPLGTVRVRNKAPGPEAPAVERDFALQRSVIRGSVGETSAQFRVALASATFAEVLRGSPFVGEVSLQQVGALAAEAQRAEYPADAELVWLIRRAAGLPRDNVAVR